MNQVLPDSTSPNLHLNHPTDEEFRQIWQITSSEWKDALTVPQYLEEYAYLAAAPLARDKGMTPWILVDKTQPPNKRAILASCETFRKKSLTSDADGNCSDVVTHGIASVYCDPKFRGRGYASRLMRELRRMLPDWQADGGEGVVASVLFSDIGPGFYQRCGWIPFPSCHLEFEAVLLGWNVNATRLYAEDLGGLCERDEAMLRVSMKKSVSSPSGAKRRFAVIPDHDHVLWHHAKEEFGGEKLFGKRPRVKGAIAGTQGNQVWAIWTHRFYGRPDSETSQNTLYILRLVVENQSPDAEDSRATESNLKAVLQAAQAEAAKWKLRKVKLWNPSDALETMVKKVEIQYLRKVRTQDSISCLQWYGEGDGTPESLEWLLNEKYGWC